MAVQTITYDDKSYLNQNSDIADVNKINDTDMNMIKTVVNNNATELTNMGTYSLNEIATGEKWIDGSDIYTKVLDLGNISWGNQIYTFPHGISNSGVFIKIKWIGLYNGNWYSTWDSLTTQNLLADSTYVTIKTTAQYATNFSQNYVLLKYTKTN